MIFSFLDIYAITSLKLKKPDYLKEEITGNTAQGSQRD